MKIQRSSAIALFIALGFKLADKWDLTRLNAKLSKVHENVGDEEISAIKDDGVRKVATQVIAALNAETAVEVVEDSASEDAPAEKPAKKSKVKAAPAEEVPAEEEAPAAPAKKVKKAKEAPAAEEAPAEETPAKPAKEKASKKSEVERDRFGNRTGSQAANINAQLSKKWTDEATIATGAGVNVARVRGHLKWLKEAGKVEAGDKGFRVL